MSFLWSEAVLVPATWSLSGVKWDEPDDNTLTLDVSGGDVASPVTATLTCDTETGLPQSFEVPWRSRTPKEPSAPAGRCRIRTGVKSIRSGPRASSR